MSAEQLHAQLTTEWREYDTVDIVAHSQGGLVARRYIADRVKRKENVRIGRAIFFDVPNMGAAVVKGTELPLAGRVASQEMLDLAPGSAMLQALLCDEEATAAHLVVPIRFVVAGSSRVVDKEIAWGIGLPGDYIVVPDRNHSTIIECGDANDPIFDAAKSWLLDPTVRSGDDPKVLTEQPLISDKQFSTISSDDDQLGRFTYWYRTIPFKGRDIEIKQLDEFLDDPSWRFAWMLLAGVGGIGKSRLALEFVLRARRDHWRAGFLANLKDDDYWQRWQPTRPTLLVIDYAAKLSVEVGVVLKALAERPQSNLLRRPVRVLLIERDADDARLDVMLAEARRSAGGGHRHPDLVLTRMDVRHIFESLLGIDGKIEAAEAALTRIDHVSRRPLFAYLIADALKHGRDVRAWDRDALLKDVIARERHLFWWPKALSLGLSKSDFQPVELALTLATMTGNLPLDNFSAKEDELLPQWNVVAHSLLFEYMTGTPIMSGIPALEPDIVGEFFVLNTLATLSKLRLLSSKTMAEALVERAWSVDGLSTASFFNRILQDFPEDVLAFELMSRVPPAPAAHEPWSVLVMLLINHLAKSSATQAKAFELYKKLKTLAAVYPADSEIQKWNARARSGLIYHFRADPITQAQAPELYEEFKALALANPVEISKWQTGAALHLINHLAGSPTTHELALELYQEMKALAAAAHPDESKIRLQQAEAAYSLIDSLCSVETTQALSLYHELKALAAAHRDESEIQKWQATAASQLIYYLRAVDVTRALELYQDLKVMGRRIRMRSEILLEQARAAYYLIYNLRADATRALGLYQELKAVAEVLPDRSEIQKWQAAAASNLINPLAENPAMQPQALALYQELKALAAVLSDEIEICKWQAGAAYKLIYCLRTDPTTRPQALELYQELKALAAAHEDESDIQEWQATAASQLIFYVREDDVTRALELYQDLKVMAEAHPDEK